jgi:hypothetical protein
VLDLALGLGIMRRAADVISREVVEDGREIEQPQPMTLRYVKSVCQIP